MAKFKIVIPRDRTLSDHLALILSAVVSPFVALPALMLGANWLEARTNAEFWAWSLVALIFFVGIPPLYIYREVQAGRITDFHVQIREQRFRVFIVFLLSTALGSVLYSLLGVPPTLLGLLAVVFGSAVIAGLITLLWKISLHAWTVSGAITAFALLAADARYLWLLLLVPVVIWSRIHRQRHTLAQGIAGGVMGVLVTWLLYLLLN